MVNKGDKDMQKTKYVVVRRATNEIVRYCNTERSAIKFAWALSDLSGNKTAFKATTLKGDK